MVKIRYLLNLLNDRFTATFHHEAPVNVFCKVLYIFVFIKIVFSWNIAALTFEYFPISETSSWFGKIVLLPAMLASVSYTFFCVLYLALLGVAIAIKRNYITAMLIAWFAWSYYVMTFQISSGADYIMLMLLFLSVPMCSYPRAKDEIVFFLQKVGHNLGLIMCQLQISLVYLISGLDKIESTIWQTGDAIQYVDRLSFLANPNLAHLLPHGELLPFILSWLTIIFELSFSILVWFREYRAFILIVGVIFHLAIAVFLSLPDFGLIMIISYIPFLTNMVKRRKKEKPVVRLLIQLL